MLNISTKGKQYQKKSKEEVMESQPHFPGTPVVGRIVRVVDYGHQPMTVFGTGEPKDPEHRIGITVEFPFIRTEDDKPAWITKMITVKDDVEEYHPKAGIIHFLQAVVPDCLEDVERPWEKGPGGVWKAVKINEFSWSEDVINTPVLCNTGVTSGGYNKIISLSQLPQGMEVPELENETLVWEMNPDQPDEDGWKMLNDFERRMIMKEVNNPEVWKDLDDKLTDTSY